MFKNNALLNRFLLEFSSLWLPKMEAKFNVFRIFIENLLKPLIFQWKIAIFLVLNLQNWGKFRCKFWFENYIGKNRSQSEFGHRFWPPKTTKIAPKSDVKRSLFRDAMETARKSSQGNGPRRL